MIQLTPHHTILLAVQPIDFRKGIDGLVGLCKNILTQNPFSGTVFVFTSKRRHSVKLLVYDGQGFWLITKRFSQGKLPWWPSPTSTSSSCHELAAYHIHILLQQGNPLAYTIPPDWRPLLKPPGAAAGATMPSVVPPVSGGNSMVATSPDAGEHPSHAAARLPNTRTHSLDSPGRSQSHS